MAREIVVFSMQDNSREAIRTNAETWGQVKRESSKIANMASGMKVTIKENRTTIESDDSVLPDEDVTLFLFPAKVKAGISEVANKIIEDYTENLSIAIVDALEKDLQSFEEIINESVGQ